MLGSYGGMLPSPQQSSQVPSTPTATSLLPTTPPQTADLDTILATYSNQPELLKLIIASKTEEDRRWAEEARFKMMDLIMRGENRGIIMTGYEGLLGQVVPGPAAGASPGGTPVSTITTGNIGASPVSSTVTTSTANSTAGVATTIATAITTATSSSTTPLGLTASGKHFMDDGFDSYSGSGEGGNTGGGDDGFGQGSDQGLSRKRSVTFARDVHHGHLRSQSMSSMPSSVTNSTSTATASTDHFGPLSLMGLTGPNPTLQSQQQPSFHQQQLQQPSQHQQQHQIPHPSLNQLQPLTLQQQFQQQHFQQQQHQQQQAQQLHSAQHAIHQQLPPQFGQYPQVFPYHAMTQLQPPNLIRRTSSLSHLSQFAQSQHATVTEHRLAAGRPRNDSASSFRTMDDSDEESDDDYSNHPVMGGLNSRPGSSLSMNNMMGGNGETSLTLDFSDMASVSGHGSYNTLHQQQQQHQQHIGGQHIPTNSPSSILSSLHGPGSTVPMSMSGLGSNAGMRAVPSNTTGSTVAAAQAAAAAQAVADQKRKRKRREMQPVNKIIESPEPHVDKYLWKNNGNTTQKKTGCKSIYYKCSNSAGGCTVNKTVTEKEGGGYITKYRGEHLEDCIKFKRAQLAAQAAQTPNNAYTLQREQ
ncbi:hypothetical protein EDD11_004771 [Mortierella claussenii]|nr:hypothetical protein EDD11_004771 [Mortierella claussenii]